jgi:thioredoxin 1
MSIQEITSDEEFNKLIKNNFVIVDFYAHWCGPCKGFVPKFKELSQSQKYVNVKFAKVNVDEVQEVADLCQVKSLPTFMAFENGQIFDSTIGANYEQVVKLLNDLITID